jgi:hypothetical protein
MRRFIIICSLMSIAGISSAQQKNSAGSWRFHSINSVGLIEGQAGSAFQLQTINGAGYKSWFGGVGLGIDYYRYRTIPLFIDIRREFGQTGNKLFAYADLGINFSWLTDNQKMNYHTDDHFGNGFYSDLGLGYKIAVGRNNGLLLSIGYSYKKITETYQSYYYFDPPYNYTGQPPGDLPVEKIQYSLNRLNIKMGWVF